jgi:hypothetical protein
MKRSQIDMVFRSLIRRHWTVHPAMNDIMSTFSIVVVVRRRHCLLT